MSELALQLNIDMATLSKIENDYRHLPIKHVNSLATIFKEEYETVEKYYLYSNFLRYFSDVPSYKDKIISILVEEPKSISEIIQKGKIIQLNLKAQYDIV